MTSALHLTDLGYYPKAAHHFRERVRPIDQYVFIYCADGCGWYELNGRHFDVYADQFFILPAGAPHKYGADENNPWTIYWIHFGGTMAQHYAGHNISPVPLNPGVTSRIKKRNELFEEIYNTLNSSMTLESLRYAMGVLHHYLSTLAFLNEYRMSGPEKFDTSIVKSVIHFLSENIEKRLTLKDISDFSGFSVSYLSAIFKAETGYSPLTYFNLLKIRYACDLLENTDMKLNQISFKLGITDPFYFSRLFTKIMGMSPKAYRTRPKT